ncbi:MAG TPA: outer membrane beta-barrel protein [Acetobacteraceae bacterium]|nr:outer membrane beta-barrel protein [Acetobacteraceae bacterium]
MRLPTSNNAFWLAMGCLSSLIVAPALAQAQQAPAAPPPAAPPPAASGTAAAPAAAPAAPAPPPPGLWIDGIHFGLQLEGGFTINPATPSDGVNFGELFNDRANQAQLNQLMVTINKPTDPNAKGFDWGFMLQGMYGSDARYTHSLGVFDMNPGPNWENQFDVVEAAGLLHIPGPTAGGTDVTAGLYPTPLGYEVINPTGNPFYSHSYIFSFGLPLKHTGIMATTHVSPLLDLYYGIDTGVNTTFVQGVGDDNSAPAGLGGFGLNMMGGNLTVLALTHIGPENSTLLLDSLGYHADDYLRYYNDIVVTWKATDKLTLTTEANWVRDDFDGFFVKGKPSPANAFGVAQYFSYTLSDVETLNVRAEIYRDDTGFFVTAYPNNVGLGNNNFVGGELGLPGATSIGAGKATTYGEITVGMTFKPNLPAPITGLLIRPELRVDNALSGGHPFGTSMNAYTQVTIASDFVLTF